jgi:hypothetical protein
MGELSNDTTYPIPRYWKRFRRLMRRIGLFKKCDECRRLERVRDSVYASIAQSNWARPNVIRCELCGVEYKWSFQGLSPQEGGIWGWTKVQQ